MKLTSQMIKDRARELGIDCIAIGNIERFKDAPTLMSPLTYFPEAKSVIAIGMRIPRGTYRGIEEGTHWHNYTFYSYNKLNSYFRPRLSYELACFIEDHGWEAALHYPAVPEGNGTMAEPVAPGKVPPDVICSVRVIAAGCGLGEIGFSKVFLTKEFGPRVRVGIIITELELEPDPIMEPGTLCNRCMACVRECPGGCIPADRTIKENVGGYDLEWADVDMGKCDWVFQGGAQVAEGETGDYFGQKSKAWEGKFKPSDISPFNKAPRNLYNTGKAICGAKGCTRACMISLEKRGLLGNKFQNPFRTTKPWKVDWESEAIHVDYTPPYKGKNSPNTKKTESETD